MNPKYGLSYETLLKMNGQPVYVPFVPFKHSETWHLVCTCGDDTITFYHTTGYFGFSHDTYGKKDFLAFRESYQEWNQAVFAPPRPWQTVQVLRADHRVESATYTKNGWLGFDQEVLPLDEIRFWRPFDKPLPVVYVSNSPYTLHIPAQSGLTVDELQEMYGKPVYVPPNGDRDKGSWYLVSANNDDYHLTKPGGFLYITGDCRYGSDYFAVDAKVEDWNNVKSSPPQLGERVQVSFGQKCSCMEYHGDHWLEHYCGAEHSINEVQFWKPMADASPLLAYLVG